MASILSVFKPAPHIDEIQDQEEVKKLYKYWRIRIFYSMFVGYALYYITRKSFTFAMPGLIANLGMDKSELGFLGSVFAITYGLSKFASGIISDRSNPRYFMAVGLMLTGVFNIFFGMASSITLFAIFWGLNGWFQGFGWPPCARFLTQWYSHSERGSWWSTWNVSHNFGAFLSPWIAGACMYYFGWRYAMYVPGVLCIFGGFYLINRLRDTPQSMGLPSIEKFRDDYAGWSPKDDDGVEPSAKELLVEYVLKNKFMWMLAFAYFFVYVVRQGINDWTSLYLQESKGYTVLGANGCVSLFEVGGFCGSLAAGWLSDRLFAARRGPVNVIFSLGMFVAIMLMWAIPAGYAWLDSVVMFVVGFMIFGPQMLIGVAAAELSHKKAAATATGFIGYIAYMGAAVAGYPLGKVTQDYGWDGYFWFMAVCCVVAVVLLIPLWGITHRSRSQPQAAEPKPKPA